MTKKITTITGVVSVTNGNSTVTRKKHTHKLTLTEQLKLAQAMADQLEQQANDLTDRADTLNSGILNLIAHLADIDTK